LQEDDVVITFNYDLVIEDALFAENIAPDYGFKEQGDEILAYGESHRQLLLKLHGSINWRTDGSGKTTALCHQKLHPLLKLPGNQDESLTLIPPSWDKAASTKATREIWMRAVKELSEARQIAIIGYSLPVSDVFFKHLLAISLGRNEVLSVIAVINPSEEVEERYESLFTRPMTEHQRLVVLGWTFEDLIMRLRDPPAPDDWSKLNRRNVRR
jgi:hypothetical protein